MISKSCGYAAAATALLALSGVSSFGESNVHPHHYYLNIDDNVDDGLDTDGDGYGKRRRNIIMAMD